MHYFLEIYEIYENFWDYLQTSSSNPRDPMAQNQAEEKI